MMGLFRKILVPLDFTVNSDIALRKAMDLIDSEDGVISLVHIRKPLFAFSHFLSSGNIAATAAEIHSESEIQKKLQEYKLLVQDQLPGLLIETGSYENMKVQKGIIRSSRLIGPDLIIIARRGDKHYLPFSRQISPGRIAKKTNCPVLTIKPGAMATKIKNIVLPITNRVPERKLDLAIRISKKFNAKVHLVAFPINQSSENNQEGALIECFHKIKEKVPLFVRLAPLEGHNLVRATLSYAEFINADIILANPPGESSVLSFAGMRHLSDMLLSSSHIQIMDIIPYSTSNEN
ncbi:MAG TPA: universal stress protein [Puia sp.]|nr:universal stress protein [Puia sp.]